MRDLVVDLRGVTVRYGSLVALADLDLCVRAGEVVALLGPSGAGKTTLLRCMNRLVVPTAGTGTVLGVSLDADEREWRLARRRIGFIFQDYGLVDRLSVFRNVTAGRLGDGGLAAAIGMPSRATRRAALAALERVGLAGRATAAARDLSGGQRQRVAIARVLAQQPSLVLADEPVASLDPAMAATVLDLLRTTADELGSTCVATFHDVGMARRFADRVVAVRDGRVVFDGAAIDFGEDAHRDVYGICANTERPAAVAARVSVA